MYSQLVCWIPFFLCASTLSCYQTVDHLFKEISQNGFGNGLATQLWKDTLDERYRCFSGNYHNLDDNHVAYTFQFGPGEVRLKLAVPQTTKTVSDNSSYTVIYSMFSCELQTNSPSSTTANL